MLGSCQLAFSKTLGSCLAEQKKLPSGGSCNRTCSNAVCQPQPSRRLQCSIVAGASATIASVSRHTPSSYKMKKTTIIFACAAASAAALTAPPQLQDLKSNLKLKLRKQQLLRATASQNVTTPRRYASRAELKDTLISELQPNPFHWTEWPFRIGSLGAFYLSYPLAWQAVQALPSAQIKLSRRVSTVQPRHRRDAGSSTRLTG